MSAFSPLSMNRILYILVISLCAFIGACAAEPMVGGYTKAAVTNREVVKAAEFAINAHSKAIRGSKSHYPPTLELHKILRAEQQIVAGANYRIILSVKENGKRRTAEVIVWWQSWRKPEPYQLTSWTWK